MLYDIYGENGEVLASGVAEEHIEETFDAVGGASIGESSVQDTSIVDTLPDTTAVGDVTAGQAEPFIAGTPEAEARITEQQAIKDEETTANTIRQFEDYWKSLDLNEKVEWVASKTGDDPVELYETIANRPHQAMQYATAIHMGEEQPSYLSRMYAAGKDILSSAPRAAGALLDVGLSPTEATGEKFVESYSKMGGEGDRNIVGSIGQELLRDPLNIPLGAIGVPQAKAISQVAPKVYEMARPFASLAQRTARGAGEAISSIPRIGKAGELAGEAIGRAYKGGYAPFREATVGALEGAEAGLAQMADEYVRTGDAGYEDVLAGLIGGGVVGGALATVGGAAGKALQKSGIKRLDKATKEKYKLTPISEMEEAIQKSDRSYRTAQENFARNAQAGLDEGAYKISDGKLVDATTGIEVQPPASTIPLTPPSALEGLVFSKNITSPKAIGESLESTIESIGDIRSGELGNITPLGETEYDDMFRNVRERLDALYENDKLLESEYKSAINQLDRTRKDYPLGKFSKTQEEGLNPLVKARQKMDKKQKFNVREVDGDIIIKDINKDFNPSELTRSIFRDELNNTIGSRVQFARLLDRMYLSPLIPTKEAFQDMRKYGSESLFDLPTGRTISKLDPYGLRAVRLGERMLPSVGSEAEEGFLRTNYMPLFSQIPTGTGFEYGMTPAGMRRSLADRYPFEFLQRRAGMTGLEDYNEGTR